MNHQHNPIGFRVTLLMLLPALAAAQAPLSIPVRADGSFDLPPGAELIRNEIRTVAGTARSGDRRGIGSGGDGGPAAEAQLDRPSGLAMDAAGNVYVADSGNNRVRRIDAGTGLITTVAGTGENGTFGDSGPAAEAQLSYPYGIAVDAAGHVYVADSGNNRVRRIDAGTGLITTVAGTGRSGDGGDGGPATEARLDYPDGIAVDAAGHVYVADRRNGRVRRIDAETAVITTVAGTGGHGFGGDGGPAIEAQLNNPSGLAMDAAGNVYVADSGNNRVRRIEAETGLITTVAGTGENGTSGDSGPAAEAQLSFPDGIAVGADGHVYVADSGNNRVRRIEAGTGLITTVAGTGRSGDGGDGGPATEARLDYPEGIAVDSAGNVYVASGHRIRVVRADPVIRFPLGSSGEGVNLGISDAGSLTWPNGAAVLAGERVTALNGDEYVLQTNLSSGHVVAAYVTQSQTVALGNSGSALLERDEDGTWRIGSNSVRGGHRYTAEGQEYVLERSDRIWSAVAVEDVLSVPLDASGELAPPAGTELERTMVIETLAGTGEDGFGGDRGPAAEALLSVASGLAVGAAGDVYVADSANLRVRKIDVSTGWIDTLAGTGDWGYGEDGGPATGAGLSLPVGVALDADGHVYFSEYAGDGDPDLYRRLRRIDAGTGVITTVAELGWPDEPDEGGAVEGLIALTEGFGGVDTFFLLDLGLAVDANSHLYFGGFDNRVSRVDASTGTITTVAGSGEEGFAGDGGPAAEAQLAYPLGLALDADGNLYFADAGNHRIRRVDASTGTITTVAGNGVVGFAGDGGPAAEAQLAYPVGLALDADGNLYVADAGNRRIRRVDASTRTITTVAGSGVEGFLGDGGQALKAQFMLPWDVAADADGKVYVSDVNRLRVARPGVLISVPLGASGKSVAFEVSPEGLLFRGGSPVLDGSEVTSENGDTYTLTRSSESVVLATYVPPTQSVELATGVSVMLARDEDGTWRIGDTAIRNGSAHVHEGKEYTLELADGRWRTARYAIRTVAGTTAITEGIGGAEASLFSPLGVATDSVGNVYVADAHRIRRIDVSGVISTFAGTGDWGYGGDGGPADEARLAYPIGMATDSAGNLYVADRSNNRVRKIDPMGEITTIAGTGEEGYSGDGGPAAEARLFWPRGVALDATGNIYLTDTLNYRVRKVDAETGIITTVAGTGEPWEPYYYVEGGSAVRAEFDTPSGVATDSAGNVYVADSSADVVRKIDAETGIIGSFAGMQGERGYGGDGGPARQALLDGPYHLATDTADNLYVPDAFNHRLRKIDASTGVIETLAGTGTRGYTGDGGPATEAQLAFPRAVAVDATGNLYVSDQANYRVRKIDAETGVIETIAGTGDRTGGWDGGPAEDARLVFLRAVAVDGAGTLFFADSHRVWKLDASGEIVALAGTGESGYSGDDGPAAQAQLSYPRGLAVDNAGNVFVADSFNSRVRKIDAAGNITTLAGTGERGYSGDAGPAAQAHLARPEGIAVDNAGNVFVADTANFRVRRIDAAGTITTLAGTGESGDSGDGGPAAQARLGHPGALAVDITGNVFVADIVDHSVRRIDAASRNIETVYETDGYDPSAVAVDEEGNVYVGGGGRIRMIDPSGEVSVIAGTGAKGFVGDGEPAGGAELSVSGIAVDRFGSVWFSDPDGRRIRILEAWPGQN